MAWRIQSTVQSTKSSDPLYNLYFITLQSHLEIWLGIIGASLPTLAPIASKLIVPALSRFRSSYRKFGVSSCSRKDVSRTVGDSSGVVPLQRTRFRRLEEESLGGTNDAQHWGNVEGTREEGPFITGIDGNNSAERPNAILVRHEYDVSAETSQQV